MPISVTSKIPTINMPTGKLPATKSKAKKNAEMLTSTSREPPGLEVKIPTGIEASYIPKQRYYVRTKLFFGEYFL